MSKFDRRDPGTDPRYCDALDARPRLVRRCTWCNNHYTNCADDPYCSAECAAIASNDDNADYRAYRAGILDPRD